ALRQQLTDKVGLPLPWHRMRLKKFFQGFLQDGVPLLEQGLYHGAQLDLSPTLRGGGGDGGSTGAESRDCYLEMYKTKKADKVDPSEENFARWSCCQLSGEPLGAPCVCDELGTLFNKEAILKGLVHKSLPPSLGHITSLKHLVDLKLTANPTRKTVATNGENYTASKEPLFQCPVTGLGFTGKFGFSALRKTGHVVSQKALKEFPQVVEDLVGEKWEAEDVIPINGTEEEVDVLRERMIKRRQAAKGKKGRKRSRPGEDQQPQNNSAGPKKVKATDFTPANASKHVYASIFSSSRPEDRETYMCRSTGARGVNLT
ncbi:unnamed protein product, partial [Ostreobium quekettii]